MVALGHSIPILVVLKIVVLTFFTSAQCDIGCPVLVPSVCLQVTCQNLSRTGSVDCLNPAAFIPQGTIATYRCIPHRGKDDGNRTYTMMCICDGKWMGIDRFLRFRDWCAGSTDTGPFLEDDSQSSPSPPEDLVSMSTSENARFLGGETTNPSVPTTTLKFLEAVSTGLPLGTTSGSEVATSTSQTQATTGATAVETIAPANTTAGAEAGTTTTIQPGTGSTPTPASGIGSETPTTLSPNTVSADGSNATETTPSTAGAGTTGSFPISTGLETGEGTNTTPTSANTGGQKTEAAGQGTTTSSEGLTTVPPSVAGNVSSENMIQGKNNSREGEGRTLFDGSSNTTAANGTEPTPSGETATPVTGTMAATTQVGAGTGGTAAPTTEQPGAATVTPAVISGTESTPPAIASGEITALPSTSSVEGVTTTTETSFIVTTHEPPTMSPGEEGAGNETGTTATPSSILVTTTIAALTTTNVPATTPETESPVAPPETLQRPDNSTVGGPNATSSNTSSEISSAPSPGEANCGEEHMGEGAANYTDFQLVGLELHNTYRRMHNVSDVKLNQTLNARAQEWAEHELTEKTLQVTPGKRNYAENLYKVSGWRAITPVRAVQEAVKTWYSSVDRYNWAQPNPTGFSQIVWQKTTDIGVGVAKKDDVTVVAVTYWPRGNIILVSSNGNQTVDSGKLFRENVFPKVAE